MEELALAVCRECRPVGLRDVPVHVPLDVAHGCAREDAAERLGKVVDHVGPAHVEDELLPAFRPRATGDADRPVRVRPVQIAVHADHLRFDPDPESDPKLRDPAADPGEPVGQLAQIRDPVAKRAVVRVAVPEPAIVEDEQLDPQVATGSRDLDEAVGVEVEVRALPVVEEDRPCSIPPHAASQPGPVQVMEGLAHPGEPLVGPYDHGLRRSERLARLQPPYERLGLDPKADPCRPERFDLRLGQEVAGVHEAAADRLAGCLVRGRPPEGRGTGCALRRMPRAGSTRRRGQAGVRPRRRVPPVPMPRSTRRPPSRDRAGRARGSSPCGG